jgi:nicotinamide mononucleotide transporter
MNAPQAAVVDFWIVWVLVDLVGVPLAIKSGLYVSGVVYGVLFVMVLIGFRRRLTDYRRSATARTQGEAVAT